MNPETTQGDTPLADLPPEHDVPARGPMAMVAYIIGGVGLMGATFVDSLAVAGRHLGLGLLGSIELVQVSVILLGAAAMVIATMTHNHASVHIFTERMRPKTQGTWKRIAAFISGLAFLTVAAGSMWVLSDTWAGFEETELLHIPIKWLRLVWVLCALTIAGLFLRQAVQKGDA